ncbi:MAG: transcriptional repressor [Rhodobacteraceae bacterium]|nr:MAG: transcriptional repressor [Paracoccaceae bacterium]
MPRDTPSPAFRRHDHAACRAGAMAAAQRICAERKLRLTPVRARALEILLESHRAMGAYDLLQRLNAEGLGSQPPVAYRALDFLVEHGFAHRIEKLNAFIACSHPGEGHAAAFLICRACGAVAETAAPPDDAIAEMADAVGFAVERAVVEIEGRCPRCRQAAGA